MNCYRCNNLVNVEQVTCMAVAGEKVEGLNCPSCTLCISIKIKGTWAGLEEVLVDSSKENGWHNVMSFEDKIKHFTLSQIIYRHYEVPQEQENESVFDQPDPGDIIRILCCQHQIIGFYTLKPKGTLTEMFETYAMATLDTAYIRHIYRRKGFGTTILQDLVCEYPNQDIGFSTPIATPMLKVLERFLKECPEYRFRFWEISGSGEEGNRKLIWFKILKQSKIHKMG